MNIERILVYINPDEIPLERAGWTIDFASLVSARIILLTVITEPEKLSEEEYDKKEDKYWKYLYELEDKAFEKEVKVSLIVEDGNLLDVIKKAVKGYKVDIFVTFITSKLEFSEILKEINIPLLILKAEVK